jgi:hypothetical protein
MTPMVWPRRRCSCGAPVPVTTIRPRSMAARERLKSATVVSPAVTVISASCRPYPMSWTWTVWVPTGTFCRVYRPAAVVIPPMPVPAMSTWAPFRGCCEPTSTICPVTVPVCASTSAALAAVRNATTASIAGSFVHARTCSDIR